MKWTKFSDKLPNKDAVLLYYNHKLRYNYEPIDNILDFFRFSLKLISCDPQWMIGYLVIPECFVLGRLCKDCDCQFHINKEDYWMDITDLYPIKESK